MVVARRAMKLMCNSKKRSRSRNLMLSPYLDQKAVMHAGSRLLARLIVRPHRRLVEGYPLLFGHSPSRSPIAYLRAGDPHPCHTRSVAALQKREGLPPIRLHPSSPVFPYTPLPEPVQSKGESFGGRDESPPASSGQAPRRALGRLSRPGHYPHPGRGEGESLPQRAVLWAGYLRQERFQNRMGLWVQGGAFDHPRGGHYGLLPGRGLRRRAAHRRFPYSLRRPRGLPRRQGVLLGELGETLASSTWRSGSGHSQRQLQKGVAADRSALGFFQTPDYRGGHKPAQGSVFLGAPSGQDLERSADALGCQGYGLHGKG